MPLATPRTLSAAPLLGLLVLACSSDASDASGDGEGLFVDTGPGRCGSEIETEEFVLTNQARAAEGLPTYVCDAQLVALARAHSQDMCDQSYFNHTSLDGRTPFDRMSDAGVVYRAAGENIAKGQQTAGQAHETWMGSDGHRGNILSPDFGLIGIGYVKCAGGPLWTQVFTD